MRISVLTLAGKELVSIADAESSWTKDEICARIPGLEGLHRWAARLLYGEAELAGETSLSMLDVGDGASLRLVLDRSGGDLVLSACGDGTARLWSTESNECVREFRNPRSYVVRSAAFSADGAMVVTAGLIAAAHVWSLESGRCIRSCLGHRRPVLCCAFSPDSARVITASEDATANVFDIPSGERVHMLRGHGACVNSAAYSLDGTMMVTASDDMTAKLWDAGGDALHPHLAGTSDPGALRGHLARRPHCRHRPR